MKAGDLKKLIREAITPAIEEMCGKSHKRDELYEEHPWDGQPGAWSGVQVEEYGDYDAQPAEPQNPDYMRGYEDGFEAGKIGAAMYGESKEDLRNPNIGLWQESKKRGKK